MMKSQTGALPVSPLQALLERFFAAKSACDVDGTLEYFSGRG